MRRFTIYAAWLLLFLFVATMVVNWTTDFWWFSALGQRDTFLRMMAWRVGGFMVGATCFALIFGQNVRLALSYLYAHTMDYVLLGSGINRFGGPSFDTIKRASTVATYIAIFLAGIAVANRFELWVALFYALPTGHIDAASNRDIGFFLFTLPALKWIWNFFGTTFFLSFCFCAGLYLWSELIETGPQILRVSRRVATHLAYLSALLIVWQGVQLGIQIIAAPVGLGWTRSEIFGPADEHYRIPTLFFFLITSLPLGYLVARRSFEDFSHSSKRIPIGIIASLWLGLSFVLPALSAPFGRSINSSEKGVEAQRAAIVRHMESTRRAWQIDNIPSDTIKPPSGEWVTTPNVPVTSTTYKPAENQFVKEDLWPLESLRQSLNQSEHLQLPADNTIARVHAVSQKDGVIYRAVSQNLSSNESEKATLLEVLPASGTAKVVARRPISSLLLTENQPDITRDTTQYVAPLPEEQLVLPSLYRLSSDSSFSLEHSGFLTSFLLACRFHDTSLLTPGKGVSWYLDPVERAETLFPFIDFGEGEATPQIIGDRLYWNVAGFSSSRDYPNSATAQNSLGWRGVNYLRQSTAVVMDGETGRTFALQLSSEEPFSQLWQKAFPQAFTPLQKLPLAQDTVDAIEASTKPTASFIKASAQILSHYRHEPEEEANFEDPKKLWRVWNPQQSQNWLCAFSPAHSSVSNEQTGTFIESFFQTEPKNFISNPRINWREFRPEKPIKLPDDFMGETSSEISNPINPTLFRFKLQPSSQENRETRLTLIRSTASKDKNQDWNLEIKSASIGETDNRTVSAAENMTRSATLWRQWKEAVKEGDWAMVQEKERQLENIFSKF